jgi:hypothetical protein
LLPQHFRRLAMKDKEKSKEQLIGELKLMGNGQD